MNGVEKMKIIVEGEPKEIAQLLILTKGEPKGTQDVEEIVTNLFRVLDDAKQNYGTL